MAKAFENKRINEKIAEVKFEKFGFANLNIGIKALFAEGLKTALVLDAGDHVCHYVLVFRGCLD